MLPLQDVAIKQPKLAGVVIDGRSQPELMTLDLNFLPWR